MIKARTFFVLGVLGCVLTVPLPTLTFAANVMGLPDCQGNPVVMPASVVIACGDGNLSAAKLTWTGWGRTFAAARGTASANDCTPNCAAGHDHTYAVVLIADGRQSCPDGRPAYARLTLAFIGRAPDPTGASPTSYPLHCGPRRA